MENFSKKIYIYDGTYYGLMTAIFEVFSRKEFSVQLITNDKAQLSFFDSPFEVETNTDHAQRVLKGLKTILKTQHYQNIFRVFLSEKDFVVQALFEILIHIFKTKSGEILDNYSNANVMLFHDYIVKIRREAHRMKAFIRFKKANDNLYYCVISPDFNVLPLILTFFKNRYADQRWLIYDVHRKYGMMHEHGIIEEVVLNIAKANELKVSSNEIDLDDTELHYQTLWQHYFKSTNIEARKNIKLHLQHVPKRYWKYLVEKQDKLM